MILTRSEASGLVVGDVQAAVWTFEDIIRRARKKNAGLSIHKIELGMVRHFDWSPQCTQIVEPAWNPSVLPEVAVGHSLGEGVDARENSWKGLERKFVTTLEPDPATTGTEFSERKFAEMFAGDSD